MFKVDPTIPLPSVDGDLDFEKQATWNRHLARSLAEGSTFIAARLNAMLPKDGSEAMTGPLTVPSIVASGAITASSLHVTGPSALDGAVTTLASLLVGTTLSYGQGPIVAGTYTPTLTNTTNVAASTAFDVPWMRVGNIVTVGVSVNIDPTLAAPSTTVLEISLPVASNFAAVTDLTGTAMNNRAGTSGDVITASIANDRAVLTFSATSVSPDNHNGTFIYRII